jgi:hypothetical protein
MPERMTGFRGEFLWEWEIAERQLLQLANSFNASYYEWRPHTNARSVSEVLVHVSCATFMILEWLGTKAPVDLYAELPEQPTERVWVFVRKNDELEHGLREKDSVVALLNRALASARDTISSTEDADLEKSLPFFGYDRPSGLPAAARAHTRTHGTTHRIYADARYASTMAGLETGSTELAACHSTPTSQPHSIVAASSNGENLPELGSLLRY